MHDAGEGGGRVGSRLAVDLGCSNVGVTHIEASLPATPAPRPNASPPRSDDPSSRPDGSAPRSKGPAPFERERVSLARSRELIIRRLLALGLSPATLRTLLPERRALIDRLSSRDA